MFLNDQQRKKNVLTLKSGSVSLLNEPTMKRLPVSVSTILANVVYLKLKLNIIYLLK